MTINEQIVQLRIDASMSRKEFSEHFGIPLRTLEDWESNRRTPPQYIPRLLCYQWKYELLKKQDKFQSKESQRNVDIVNDTKGNKIVIIHDTIFKNKQNINWSEVEVYLKQYIGEMYTIADDGEKIYIGKDLPDEYANSRYTEKLKGALAKTKANASQAIPELIEISLNPAYSENIEPKHSIDAKFGWYRYDSRFALAVYNNEGEVERYNFYKVRMIIRHDADGKKYLYDVINIKKEPSTPLGQI